MLSKGLIVVHKLYMEQDRGLFLILRCQLIKGQDLKALGCVHLLHFFQGYLIDSHGISGKSLKAGVMIDHQYTVFGTANVALYHISTHPSRCQEGFKGIFFSETTAPVGNKFHSMPLSVKEKGHAEAWPSFNESHLQWGSMY